MKENVEVVRFSPRERVFACSFPDVDVPVARILKDVVPQERVPSQIHEHNFLSSLHPFFKTPSK